MNDPSQIVRDVACPGCGCMCDDLTLHVRHNQIQKLEVPCTMAGDYFQQALASVEDCQVNGHAASIDQAIQAAAKILNACASPLYFGLGETTNETVRSIVDLAEATGGHIDAAHPTWFDPSGRILQTTGMVTTTLGEIRHRANVVLFWGCDPETTAPRHLERFSADPSGRLIAGRTDRHLVSLVESSNATSAKCDETILLSDQETMAVLQLFSGWANKQPLDETAAREILGDRLKRLRNVFQRIEQASYFAFVVGDQFCNQGTGRAPLERLAEFVRKMHENNRGAISVCRPGPNWVGAKGVVASRTNYPGQASFAKGFAEYDPDNAGSRALLQSGSVDACLLLEGPWLKDLPEATHQALRKIPTISLGHRQQEESFIPTVRIPIARPGVQQGGTMSRMDDIPLPLRTLLSSELPLASEVIQKMHQAIRGAR